MRERAFICLLDIRAFCSPIETSGFFKDSWQINSHLKQLFNALASEYIQEKIATNPVELVIFGSSPELNMAKNSYTKQLTTGSKKTIHFGDLCKLFLNFTETFYAMLDAQEPDYYHRRFFQKIKFTALDQDNHWHALTEKLQVTKYDQIVCISHDKNILSKANELGCIPCPIYHADEWNESDAQHAEADLRSISSTEIAVSFDESLNTSDQQTKVACFFNVKLTGKEAVMLTCAPHSELPTLMSVHPIIIRLEKNSDLMLSLWLQCASITQHIIRVHEFGEFHHQLPSIIAKWLKLVPIEKQAVIAASVAPVLPNHSITTQGTQTTKTDLSPDCEDFDDCVVEKKLSAAIRAESYSAVNSAANFFGSLSLGSLGETVASLSDRVFRK